MEPWKSIWGIIIWQLFKPWILQIGFITVQYTFDFDRVSVQEEQSFHADITSYIIVNFNNIYKSNNISA